MRLNYRTPILIGMLILAACAQQPATEDAGADATAADAAAADAAAAAISANVDQFVAAWNTGDNATVGQAIAEDAILMQPDGAPIEGRDAIVATITGNYDIAASQQSATVEETIAMGDYAYARGTWKLDPTPAAADAGGAHGKWTVLYRRGADGAWQMWRWMWNQPPAIPAAIPAE